MNLDLLGHLADFQNDIDHRTRIDLQHDAALYVSPESRQSRFQPIRTKDQVRQNIGSGFIRDGRSRNARFRLRHLDFDARQHRAALVSCRPADLRRRLRPHAGTRNQGNE